MYAHGNVNLMMYMYLHIISESDDDYEKPGELICLIFHCMFYIFFWCLKYKILYNDLYVINVQLDTIMCSIYRVIMRIAFQNCFIIFL